MPMMNWLFCASAAQAGTAVWLSGPIDPSRTPGDKARSAEAVAPNHPYGADDQMAIEALASELEAVRPLLDEFDGELAIIRQLEVRLAAVEVLRAQDRDLVWRVLVLQGLAVHRYFPDLSSHEADGAGVVRRIDSQTFENGPWADAIALFPDRMPEPKQIGDEAARVALQEQRARALIWPTAELKVRGLPPGAALLVDGQVVPGGALTVIPGHHRWTVERNGVIHLRGRAVVAPKALVEEAWLAPASDIADLAAVLSTSRGAVALPPAVVRRFETLDAPVSVVVAGRRDLRVFRIEGENAVLSETATSDGAASPARFWVMGGAGWLYDGNFFVHNAASGAPNEPGTVNAVTPVVGVGGQLPLGPVHVGLGTDVLLPLGASSTVPTDDTDLRARVHPHGALGWGPIAATVGFYAPWHLGVGLRGALPLREQWSLTGAFVQGVGLSWARDVGPAFTPEASRVGWLGMAWRWPE